MEINPRICTQKAKCYQIPLRNHLIDSAYDFEWRLSRLIEEQLTQKPHQQIVEDLKKLFWPWLTIEMPIQIQN